MASNGFYPSGLSNNASRNSSIPNQKIFIITKDAWNISNLYLNSGIVSASWIGTDMLPLLRSFCLEASSGLIIFSVAI